MQQSLTLWIKGARPRTLPAAIAPVLVGSACVALEKTVERVWINSSLALVVSLALQVAVNFANDYSDGGTDQQRVGPLRLVGSGSKSAASVKRAAFIAFGVAAICGLVLAVTTTLWLLTIGVMCLAAGWFYTGGENPYGYIGLGEVFVFIFFGVVATVGTTFVVIQKITFVSFLSSVVVGCLACALLAVNNLRDIAGDTISGKRTLAVRLGDQRARKLFVSLFIVAALAIIVLSLSYVSVLLGLAGLATAILPIRKVRNGAIGADLIAVLGMTGRTQIATAVALSLGLLIAGR